ncbi:MAG: cell division protein [Culicoidibacterales bacterium]
MNNQNLKYLPMLAMLPAIVVGTIAMAWNAVSAMIYLQNLICFAILMLVAHFLFKNQSRFRKWNPMMVIIFSVFALLATFLNADVDGVHRWIAIGPIQLYVSAIVIPIIMIAIWRLLQQEQTILALTTIGCITIILALQPDASMVTAFSVVSLIMIWHKVTKLSKVVIASLLVGLSAHTWIFLDTLAPVAYVEGIFEWVSALGVIATITGIAALVLMIIPFFICSPKKDHVLAMCFGLFYSLILLSNSFGHFPVPLMGYGISPVIGYFIAITWLVNPQITAATDKSFD